MQVKVDRWIDGDTFAGVLDLPNATGRVFRLKDCWAPERGQVGFAETLAFVVTAFGNVVFDVDDGYAITDRYGRLVVNVLVGQGDSMSRLINVFVESRGYPRGRGWSG